MRFVEVGLIHALSHDARRCYDRKEAASYVGVSPTTFDKLVRKGAMPCARASAGCRRPRSRVASGSVEAYEWSALG